MEPIFILPFFSSNFLVSGNNKKDGEEQDKPKSTRGETQSAKVSISHEVVETETEWRPWTSHVVREETLQKLRRPKSAAVPIGPPKRAWTASSERKSSSAKSKAASEPKTSTATSRIPSTVDVRGDPEPGGDPSASERSQSHSSMVLSPAFIFPQYPVYPDIRVVSSSIGGGSGLSPSASIASSSQSPHGSQTLPQPLPPPTLHSDDPAVPVIQAIKNEMKRIEKDASTSTPSSSKYS